MFLSDFVNFRNAYFFILGFDLHYCNQSSILLHTLLYVFIGYYQSLRRLSDKLVLLLAILINFIWLLLEFIGFVCMFIFKLSSCFFDLKDWFALEDKLIDLERCLLIFFVYFLAAYFDFILVGSEGPNIIVGLQVVIWNQLETRIFSGFSCVFVGPVFETFVSVVYLLADASSHHHAFNSSLIIDLLN